MTVAERSDATGFIHSVTSDTQIEITPELNRCRRLNQMKRGTITAARLHEQDCSSSGTRWKAAFVTLTYKDADGWSPRHVSRFLNTTRQYLRRRGITLRYTWVLELQKRGAPHYHLLVWLPKGTKLPKPDSAGWWTHGTSNIQWARNAVAYIAKYASKGGTYDLPLPRGARIHGSGGLSEGSRMERRWWLFPRWVRDRSNIVDDMIRAPGGGFVSRVTGEWTPSPYRVICLSGVPVIIKVDQ